MEATYYNRLKETYGNTNVIDVFVPPWASQFMMIVQVEAKWDGQVPDMLMSALSGPNLHVKTVIAVDEDVDIYNAEDVFVGGVMSMRSSSGRLHSSQLSASSPRCFYSSGR